MNSITRLGTYEEVRSKAPQWMASIMDELRSRIATTHPEAVEVARTKEGAVTYGVGEKKMSEAYVYLAPFKNWLNVGFYHADKLEDPDELLEGTGDRLRHIKVRGEGPDIETIMGYIWRSKAEREKSLSA